MHKEVQRRSGEGKRLLLVYSNSPHWQVHIEERWLHPEAISRAINRLHS